MDNALRFLEALFAPYRDLPSSEGETFTCEIRALTPGSRTRSGREPREWYAPQDLARAVEDCARWRDQYNVYMGVLPRLRGGGKAVHLTWAGWLWCEVDGGSDGWKEAALRVRRSMLPTPHMAVKSGGGVHCYWGLSDLAPLHTEGAREAYKSLLRRIVRVVGGTKPAAHGDITAAECVRILRVPDTYNHKTAPPVTVRLLHYDLSLLTHDLAWWGGFLPPEPLYEPEKTTANRSTRETRNLPQRAEDLLSSPCAPGTRHETARSIAMYAANAGFGEEEITMLLQGFRAMNGWKDDRHEIRDLVNGALRKARR